MTCVKYIKTTISKNYFHTIKKNYISCAVLPEAYGSRKGEILSARWQDFNFENGTWLKPAALTKQNKMSYIPLNKEALEIILELIT